MTDKTPSATTGFDAAAQTKAATAKTRSGLPAARGLYDPRNEHDACGVGFVAHMKGVKSHQTVRDGLQMLVNLTHRGAVGADPLMGDGAGMLVQVPDRFFREEMAAQGVTLPEAGHYGVAHLFMPQEADLRVHCEGVIADVCKAEGLELIGLRDVPVDNARLSKAPDVAAAEPFHRQAFFARPDLTTRNTSASSTSCARSSPGACMRRRKAATTVSTSCRCRRAPSSTRACSRPGRFRPITRI